MTNVLVVDDERLIRDLLQTVLGQHGYEVLSAGGGAEAIKIFEDHRPSVTLLDLKMPDMNGLRVLKRLREIDSQASVLILSGMGMTELENEARKLGATDFLQKGRSLDNILSAVNTVAARVTTRVGTRQTTKGSVLVVDDEEPVRQLLSDFLQNRGYWVVTARNGQEALLQVNFEQPQVIVLDLRMPGMNGIAVLQELRQRQYGGRVVVLTGMSDETLLQETLTLGSIDVLAKPVDLQRLLLTVEIGMTLSAEQGFV